MIFKLLLIILILLNLSNSVHASKIECDSVNDTFRTWEFNQRNTPKLRKTGVKDCLMVLKVFEELCKGVLKGF